MLGGLEHEWIIFPNSWDDDPIWRTHIFQRGGEKPPTSLRMDEDAISLVSPSCVMAIHNLDFFRKQPTTDYIGWLIYENP